jgi:hypothetical protein
MVHVEFTVGPYHDYIDCDVVPMRACSMLFGRPWQFDKDNVHHGKTNQCSFMHNEKKLVLHPMSPDAILKDEVVRACKEKNKSVHNKNLDVTKELVQPKSDNSKSAHVRKNEIQLKNASFLASKSDLFELNDVAAICYVFICKYALFSLHNIPSTLPSTINNLLQDYADVFPKEVPPRLPPIRGIEHQIDLILGASLPNRAPYRTNPEETKEIQRQVQELLDKGYVRESLSPCSILVSRVLKKDGSWRMCVDCRGINNSTNKYCYCELGSTAAAAVVGN